MPADRELLVRLLEETPFQPATDYWRSIELAAIPSDAFPEGLGLDLGCGDGSLMGILMERLGHRALVGLDLDPAEIELARAGGPYARLHCAPADAIPEPAEAFAFVFSNSVLEHLANLSGVLDEVARVLRPSGRFVFTVPSDRFHACLRGPLFGDRDAYLDALDRRCAHVNYWSEERWRSELAARGLDVVRVVPYVGAREAQCWEFLTNLTAGVATALAGGTLRPIEVQRRFGMRSRRVRLPTVAARLVARLLPIPARVSRADESAHAGLLVIAEKRARG